MLTKQEHVRTCKLNVTSNRIAFNAVTPFVYMAPIEIVERFQNNTVLLVTLTAENGETASISKRLKSNLQTKTFKHRILFFSSLHITNIGNLHLEH
jgi:hypothetical protein